MTLSSLLKGDVKSRVLKGKAQNQTESTSATTKTVLQLSRMGQHLQNGKRMGQHLQRFHKLTDSAKIAEAKRKFSRITGFNKRKASKSKLKSPTAPKKKKARSWAPDPSQSVRSDSLDSLIVKKSSTKLSKKKPIIEDDSSEESEEDSSEESEESFDSGGSTTDEHKEVDEHELKVAADLDDISSFADSDDDDLKFQQSEQQQWRDVYLSAPTNNRVYFMSRFYKYLLHAEGGAHSEHQSLLYVCQVHIIMDALTSLV